MQKKRLITIVFAALFYGTVFILIITGVINNSQKPEKLEPKDYPKVTFINTYSDLYFDPEDNTKEGVIFLKHHSDDCIECIYY
ncbi:MAG: hypothetical protein NT068_03475 [Candidatus Nomurabacteria bacterium]|nr:hypothetical protein [Candidatus Nomurabacteria bacterium]